MKKVKEIITIGSFSHFITFELRRYIPRKIYNSFFRVDNYKIVIINLDYSFKYEHLKKKITELILNGTVCLVKDNRFITSDNIGAVVYRENVSQLKIKAKEIISDYWSWRLMAHKGYRQLMTRKSEYRTRILSATNQNLVSIILPTCRPNNIDLIIENVGRQNYFNLELIVVTQNYSEQQFLLLTNKLNNLGNLKRVKVIQDNSSSNLGMRLNNAVECSNGDFIAKFDDDDIYFCNYISDAMIPMLSFSYDVIGKKEIFIYLETQNKTYIKFSEEFNRFSSFVAGATFLIRKEIFNNIKFDTIKQRGVDTLFLSEVNSLGYKIYSADPFNFIVYRSRDVNNHTWKVSDSEFLNSAKLVAEGQATFINI